MKLVATESRRFGYRRIHVTLDRQVIVVNLKKLLRLYREEKLTVRKRAWERDCLWRYHHDTTSAAAWTSSATPSWMVVADES